MCKQGTKCQQDWPVQVGMVLALVSFIYAFSAGIAIDPYASWIALGFPGFAALVALVWPILEVSFLFGVVLFFFVLSILMLAIVVADVRQPIPRYIAGGIAVLCDAAFWLWVCNQRCKPTDGTQS